MTAVKVLMMVMPILEGKTLAAMLPILLLHLFNGQFSQKPQ